MKSSKKKHPWSVYDARLSKPRRPPARPGSRDPVYRPCKPGVFTCAESCRLSSSTRPLMRLNWNAFHTATRAATTLPTAAHTSSTSSIVRG